MRIEGYVEKRDSSIYHDEGQISSIGNERHRSDAWERFDIRVWQHLSILFCFWTNHAARNGDHGRRGIGYAS